MQTGIRQVCKNDLEILADWHEEHAAINFPDSKFKRKIFLISLREAFEAMKKGKKEVLLKIGADRKMIGWLWLKIVFDIFKDCHYCDLHYIHVAPEYRGKGIGKKLMMQADIWAQINGANEIRLGTAADNTTSINLYQKCGYKIKRVLMEKKYAN